MESVYSVAQDLGRAEEEGCPAYSLYGRKTEFAVMIRTGMVASSILCGLLRAFFISKETPAAERR
jgi:hypothetical protein